MGKPRVLYWFRTDLRLHDSPALRAALDLDPEVLWPVFTWDPHYVHTFKSGPNRWQFLLDCQHDLSSSITKLNPKSKLFVLRGAPQALIPKLFEAWKPTHLVFEKDTGPYARSRDHAVTEAARSAGVDVLVRPGRTLWDSDRVVEANGGKPTMSITQLRSAGESLGSVSKPLSAPTRLPNPGPTPIPGEDVIAGPKRDYAVPKDTKELGLSPATTPHRGGESKALKVLDDLVTRHKEYAATFKKPQTSPAQFDPPATTLLSPFLHFGALSVREFYWRIHDLIEGYKGASSPPESLLGQLLFRDMYFAAHAALGDSFGRTRTNPNCRFIPWYLPSTDTDGDDAVDTSHGSNAKRGKDYHVDNPQAETWFHRWRTGTTGFPWIDALMRQLKHDGWIHHLGRHSVACFLTRGGCYVDWERGAAVFEEFLIDHEPACNLGNWQWLACVAFFTQYYRCYSPVSFGRKWDKNGDLIRKWVPELAGLDAKYIYEPWKAPAKALDEAGVRIAGDGDDQGGAGVGGGKGGAKDVATYPEPMFDFNERRDICMAAMKKAYQVGLYGDDKKVLDGSWKRLFPDDDADKNNTDKSSKTRSAKQSESAPSKKQKTKN